MLLLPEIIFLHLILPVTLLLVGGWMTPTPTHSTGGRGGWWVMTMTMAGGVGGGTRNLEHIYSFESISQRLHVSSEFVQATEESNFCRIGDRHGAVGGGSTVAEGAHILRPKGASPYPILDLSNIGDYNIFHKKWVAVYKKGREWSRYITWQNKNRVIREVPPQEGEPPQAVLQEVNEQLQVSNGELQRLDVSRSWLIFEGTGFVEAYTPSCGNKNPSHLPWSKTVVSGNISLSSLTTSREGPALDQTKHSKHSAPRCFLVVQNPGIFPAHGVRFWKRRTRRAWPVGLLRMSWCCWNVDQF